MLKKRKITVKHKKTTFSATIFSSFLLPYSLIKKTLYACLIHQPVIKNKQVGVAFVTDKEIQKFNKRYLHKNTPTDVLAFSFTSECMSDYLGDIVISHETAQKQAALFKSSLDNELVLLLVHGILHLAGYTDYNEKEKQRMFIKQAIILKTSHEKKT